MTGARHHPHTTIGGLKLDRHYPGCWRTRDQDPARFYQIKRGRHYSTIGGLQDRFVPDVEGRHYLVEIREVVTGDLIRYAGVHRSLRGAVDEIKSTGETK